MKSSEVVAHIRSRYGSVLAFVFVDAVHSHKALQSDWTSRSSLIRTGGTIALHDSLWISSRNIDGMGPLPFNQHIALRGNRLEVAVDVDSPAVLQRRS